MTRITNTTLIADDTLAQVTALKRAGTPEWLAVATVLGLPGDANFIVVSAGTSSRPSDDRLLVHFFILED